MRVRDAVSLLTLAIFVLAPGGRAETGEDGWLRYAALPPQLAQQYRFPRRIVVTEQSAVAHSAASELARGLHAMLGKSLQIADALQGEDAFILGTPAEIRRLLPSWEAPSPIAPEGFSVMQFAAQGHNYWVLAGGTDRGELYAVFRLLEQVAQQKLPAFGTESPSS